MTLRLEMHGPARVHPGQVIRYELELVGDASQVTGVELTVRATRGYQISPQVHYTANDAMAAVRYSPSGTRFPVDVVVPPAPSHRLGNLAWASLFIDVRLAGRVPIGQRFPLHVCERLDNARLEPAVVRANQHVELALGLAATRATGGTTLAGNVSVARQESRSPGARQESRSRGSPGARQDRESRVAIDVSCTLQTSSGYLHAMPIATTTLRVPGHAATTGVPFTLELPAYLPPSLAIDTHQISYQVTATHKQWRKTTVAAIPLTIVDARPAPARVRPPQVGTEDVEPMFAQLARRDGWRVGPTVDIHPQLGTIMPWIFTAQHGLVMRLGYAFRDDGSTYLVSRIRYQPLELGLRVVPSRHGGGGALADAAPALRRTHTADARDHVRAAVLLRSVAPALEPLGSLVCWDDDWLICERAVTTVDATLLDELATALRDVARQLAQVIGSNELAVGPYR